jgi:DNA-binding Lrp family transcriptional regulator
MAGKQRARTRIPDRAGLRHDRQYVRTDVQDWGMADQLETQITKSWGDSFDDPEEANSDPSMPEGPDYWFKAEVQGVDFDVHFRLGLGRDGELVVTGLLLGDPLGTQAITTSNLHRLPLGALYQSIAALNDITTALADRAKEFKGEIPSRGGQRLPDQQFKEAAELYKQCLIERPNDPIKCVSEKLGVSSATASRRVQRARDLGLLRSKEKTLAELEQARAKQQQEVSILESEVERLSVELVRAEAREESIEVTSFMELRQIAERNLARARSELFRTVGEMDGIEKTKYDAEMDMIEGERDEE